MAKILRNLLALLIIIASIISGIFIIGLKTKKQNSLISALTAYSQKNSNEYPDAQSGKAQISEAVPESTIENLTENVVEKIAGEIIAKAQLNSSLGVGGIDAVKSIEAIESVDAEEFIDQAFNEALESFDYSKLKPEIKIERIKLAPNGSSNLKENYLLEIGKILDKNYSDLNITKAAASFSDLYKLKNAAENAAKDLYALPVTRELAPLHLRQIEFAETFQNIFGIVLNFEQDPFLALLAANYLTEVGAEFAEFNNNLKNLLPK